MSLRQDGGRRSPTHDRSGQPPGSCRAGTGRGVPDQRARTGRLEALGRSMAAPLRGGEGSLAPGAGPETGRAGQVRAVTEGAGGDRRLRGRLHPSTAGSRRPGRTGEAVSEEIRLAEALNEILRLFSLYEMSRSDVMGLDPEPVLVQVAEVARAALAEWEKP